MALGGLAALASSARNHGQNILRVHVHDDEHELSNDPHPDEHQNQLNTDRSFVLYSVGKPHDSKKDREALQRELHDLLVAVLHRRPRLSYFQGYYDIITVLFPTLLSEIQLVCAEQLSVHRLRDFMGARA